MGTLISIVVCGQYSNKSFYLVNEYVQSCILHKSRCDIVVNHVSELCWFRSKVKLSSRSLFIKVVLLLFCENKKRTIWTVYLRLLYLYVLSPQSIHERNTKENKKVTYFRNHRNLISVSWTCSFRGEKLFTFVWEGTKTKCWRKFEMSQDTRW